MSSHSTHPLRIWWTEDVGPRDDGIPASLVNAKDRSDE